MKRAEQLAIAAMVCVLTSCAGRQVQRDLKHADVSRQYRSSLSAAVELNPEQHCKGTGVLNAWIPIEFTAATPIIKLPSDISAAAVCLKIPAGARALQLQAGAEGGMTFYEATVVHPSLQFLSDQYRLVKDLPKPRMSPGHSALGSFEITGIVVITEDLAEARFVLVYIHPAILDSIIDVQTGYQSIPVPFSPYGKVKIRFR
jgi:hypothetical protein